MKAKITYTVNLDEVPNEVSDLVEKIQSQMDEFVSEKLEELHPVTPENIAGTLETIDNIRKTMAELDERLEDCYSILLGYHQAKSAPTQQEMEELHETIKNNLVEGNL